MKSNRSLLTTTLIGGALTVVVNAVLLFAGKPFTGVPETFMTLSLMPVITWSILGTIGASITYALTRKFARNPDRAFVTIALVVLVLSFIPDVLVHGAGGPFMGATWRAVALLMLMHVAAAVVLVTTLVGFTRPVTPKV